MIKEDKGLKEALQRQPVIQIPSNFTYRVMLQVNEIACRHEKRKERMLFILMIVLSLLMIGGLSTWLILLLDLNVSSVMKTWINHLAVLQPLTFYLPILLTLPVLAWFNQWLQKIFFTQNIKSEH